MDVAQLREQGLTDSVIMEELSRKGYKADQIHSVLMQLDNGFSDEDSAIPPSMPPLPQGRVAMPMQASPNAAYARASSSEENSSPEIGNIYERMEEIVESTIDEKWDELIAEVKKIIEWKEKFEEEHRKQVSDIEKLKEDFKVLHQGVLGKLDDYDTRMGNVDTELRAVGKVFKDVVPQFVENVKELSFITDDLKKGKK
jgi:hypothetical protein